MVIARHGSLENTPENTFAAFEKAADIGVFGLEVDVRRTKDDKLILMHDDTIDRTTDGRGYVTKLLYDEIKLYDAGSWKGEEFTGERVPLLSDVLQFAKERNIKIILNVKEHGIEHKTLSLIEEFDMINHVYFSGRLEFLRNKNVDIKGAQLVFLPPDEETNDVIDLIHERRNHVGTKLFGTDDRDKMKERMVQGVDIILTDYPSVAIDLLHFRTINIPEEREPRKKLETNIVGNPEQIGALIDTIIQGSPDQSRMAALVFSTLPARLAIPPLVEHLDYKKPLKRFLPKIKIHIPFTENDRKEEENLLPTTLVQQNIVWALGLIKNNSAVGPLIKRLETEDSDLKREIILALKMIGDKQAVPALNEILLNDENPFTRYDAARALGTIASTDSIFTLIKALKNDKNWMVKGACAVALAGTDDKRAINELEELLNDDAGYEASWARDRAAQSLSGMGGEGLVALVSSLGRAGGRRACWTLVEMGEPVIPHLLTTLRSTSRNARRRAAMVLGWIGSKEAVKPLSWTLKDKDSEVRKVAAWALGRIGGTKAIAALKQALSDQNKDVVEYTEEAIQRINYNLKQKTGKEL
jgi:HEAT repeat protein/glycerophosphoryl diester phosphodiesterase